MTGREELPYYTRGRIRRRLRQLVMVLTALALLGCVAMVVGPFINDRKIESDPGRALAVVTAVSPLRTTVDFQDEEGIYHSPSTGLLYPTGLGEGQRVWVNYAKTEPELVKVEHRRWTLSIIPALSITAGVAVVAVLLWGLVSLLTRPRPKRQEAGTGG